MNFNEQDISLMDFEKRLEAMQVGSNSCTSLVGVEDQKSAVLTTEFHPSGDYFLSGNRDGQIRISSLACMAVASGAHSGAVVEAHFCRDGANIYSCSEDGTLGIWDSFGGSRTATLEGHKGAVNSVRGTRSGEPVLCSGGKDGTVRIWDARQEDCVMNLKTGSQVTSTSFNETGEYVFSSGQDKNINIWDLRAAEIICSLDGHSEAVTDLSLSPCGSYILSHSLDNTLRIWDIRPYTLSRDRAVHCFPSNQECASELQRCAWSPDGRMISAGTSGRVVQVLDADTGSKLLDLSSHESSVNDVAFHPDEPIMLSASNDNCLFLHALIK